MKKYVIVQTTTIKGNTEKDLLHGIFSTRHEANEARRLIVYGFTRPAKLYGKRITQNEAERLFRIVETKR